MFFQSMCLINDSKAKMLLIIRHEIFALFISRQCFIVVVDGGVFAFIDDGLVVVVDRKY